MDKKNSLCPCSNPSLINKSELCLLSLEKRRLFWGDLVVAFQYLQESNKETDPDSSEQSTLKHEK